MFRAQQNAFDDAVAKATDENLTSENWEFILDVCDKVTTKDSGPKDAVAAMIKRLAHRNANVQLYTLELANALSQNCGVPMHRELASRSFTDAMLRLAADRTTHAQVKMKIAERMDEWTKMFASNTELGVMEQAYMKLKSQNPSIQPPQAPQKQRITDFDRKREEEELQMALQLSIQDKGPAPSSAAKPNPAELSGQPAASLSAPAPSQPIPTGTTAATVSRVRALFDFQPSEAGELQFRKGDVIAVLESVYKDWWKGSLRGQAGIFPLNYVEKLQDPTADELQQEAKMEAEVFGQIKNVEKLLALLSTSTGEMSTRDNEEVTELYHSTLAIRPKLIELIGKYTQKKDDFQQLNEKFIKARRDYEALLETSMAQSAQQYSRPGQQPYGYGGGGPPPQQPYPSQPQRFYTSDGQPPNSGLPYAPNPSQQNFQAPYPVSSPPPQSITPSNQPPHVSNMDPYAQYSPQSQRRQSSHSEYHPQEMGTSVYDTPSDTHPPRHSYPPLNTTAPPPHPADPKDYSASIYSQESHSQSQPHFPPQPDQQQQQQQPPPHQQQHPSYNQRPSAPPSGPSYPPPQQPNQYQPPPSQAPPPIPQGMPHPPPDRQETPLPQSSAYPTFVPGAQQAPQPQPNVTYQAYQPQGQTAATAAANPAGYYR